MENESISENDLELLWKCKNCKYENKQYMNSIMGWIDSRSWEKEYLIDLVCGKCNSKFREIEL